MNPLNKHPTVPAHRIGVTLGIFQYAVTEVGIVGYRMGNSNNEYCIISIATPLAENIEIG